MKEEKKERRGTLDYVYIVQRLVTILAIVAAFFPAFSPSRITKLTRFHCLHQVFHTQVLQTVRAEHFVWNGLMKLYLL